jgi:hypothetical protein
VVGSTFNRQTGPDVVYRLSIAQPYMTNEQFEAGYSSTMYTYRHTYLQCVSTFLGSLKTVSNRSNCHPLSNNNAKFL